jgi:hypothetical protein
MTDWAARFSGEAWDGPATWGQQGFRDGLRRYDTTNWYANTAPSWTVPDGATLAQVLDTIGATVSRHEVLRTVFTDTPDGMRQRVRAAGELPVEVCAGGDPAETAARLRARDLSGGLPLAVAVITDRGRPTHVVTSLSHLAVDASAVRILLAGDTDTGTQPRHFVDDAAHRRRSDRAIAAWRAECAKAELPFTTVRGTPGIVQGALSSAAAARRLTETAQAAAAAESAVLLAVVAITAAAVTSRRDVFLQLVTSNRHLPRAHGYVGVLAQLAPLAADVEPGMTFGAFATRLQERSMRAYRSAFWSPADLDAGLRADGRSADTVLGAGWTFNDARGPWPRVDPVASDPGRDYALHDLPGWAYQGGRCAIAAAGDAGQLTLALRLDTAYVDGGLLRPLLVAWDAVLRRACEAGPEAGLDRLADAARDVFAHA